MNGRQRGKAHERATAKRLSGRRIGVTGLATPDVVTGRMSIECKERAALPAWLTGALDQAQANAAGGLTPIVVLHELGRRHDNDLVMLRLTDFEELYGDIVNNKQRLEGEVMLDVGQDIRHDAALQRATAPSFDDSEVGR